MNKYENWHEYGKLQMSFFDSLPFCIREKLRYSNKNYSSENIFDNYNYLTVAYGPEKTQKIILDTIK